MSSLTSDNAFSCAEEHSPETDFSIEPSAFFFICICLADFPSSA